MPILPAEPEMYPPNLWRTAPENGAKWWCLHTKPRQEKATARHLLSRQMAFYLPQVVQENRTPAGRKTRALIPLFPGYVFLRGDDVARVEAYKGNSLVNVLEVGDQTRLAEDLSQIHQMLASGIPVVAEPTHPVGSRVKIITGPLAGLVGTVSRRGNRDHFIAIVHFLGRGAAVELQNWQVERIESEG
jgi:transcription antitermination factor NusG